MQEKTALIIEEARLTRPERLLKMAEEKKMVDPKPDSVVQIKQIKQQLMRCAR